MTGPPAPDGTAGNAPSRLRVGIGGQNPRQIIECLRRIRQRLQRRHDRAVRHVVNLVHTLVAHEADVEEAGAGNVRRLVVGPAALDGDVTGIELDAWSEVVPDRVASGAVSANLAAPDSRAPNTILLAVPGTGEWTRGSLFGVVDEALELADCRLVDLDATKRIPRLLPAIYISDYDEDDGRPWREIIAASAFETPRWRWTESAS